MDRLYLNKILENKSIFENDCVVTFLRMQKQEVSNWKRGQRTIIFTEKIFSMKRLSQYALTNIHGILNIVISSFKASVKEWRRSLPPTHASKYDK